ncbi:MAG: aldehyde dehydrogenase family protein, partial [Rhodoferax sp.]|nr:aldehyde dehydrogenase family protein [Rhodoferax sp.]
MQRHMLYIDGHEVAPDGQTWFATENPFTGAPWAEIARGNASDVDAAAEAAHRAFTTGTWPQLTATQRGALLRRVADLITRDAQRLAEIEVRDNGKLMAEMLGQLTYIPQWF